MILKFRIISDENETFLRTIEISENDTFLNLHNAIQKACNYDNTQMASFFVSNNDWEKLQEITLFDMMDDSTRTIPMNKAKIKDHLSAVEDKLIYIFDFFGDRALFFTVMEIKKEDSATTYPMCTHSTGNPPIQILQDEDEFTEMFNDLETNELDEDELSDELGEGFGEEFDESNEFDEFNDSKNSYEY